MRIRKYASADYESLRLLFDEHDWTPWERGSVSPFTYLAEHQGRVIGACSFFWGQGTNLGIMGFTVVAKSVASTLKRGMVVNQLVEHTLAEADAFGIKHLLYNTHNMCESMVRFMEKKGFKVYETQGFLTVRSHGDSSFIEE